MRRGTWGKAFADFMLDHVAAGARDADKPSEDGISAAMEDLWRRDPDLAKEVHGILASLSFGLMMLNNIERFRVRRLEAETARAPDTLIQRLAGIIKRDLEDGPRPDGGRLCARSDAAMQKTGESAHAPRLFSRAITASSG